VEAESMDVLSEKTAERHPALDKLLQAKQLSDRKRYMRKNQILRDLLTTNPQDFAVSEEPANGIVGISHLPTRFQIHTLVRNLPQDFLQNYDNGKQQAGMKLAAVTRLNYILGY
jgi:hypothetical protein